MQHALILVIEIIICKKQILCVTWNLLLPPQEEEVIYKVRSLLLAQNIPLFTLLMTFWIHSAFYKILHFFLSLIRAPF